jgi:hypothetical protein
MNINGKQIVPRIRNISEPKVDKVLDTDDGSCTTGSVYSDYP